MDVLHVDASNTEQARAWDGDEGEYWSEHADRFDAAIARYQGAFLASAAIQPNDRVLDIGCGTGQTTRDAARLAPAGSALGVDLSARMLDVARARAEAEGVANARFLHADAQVYPFERGSFDVAISRTGTMFFGDHIAAFGNLARALRPGGRFVQLVWRGPADNEWFREVTTALAAGRTVPAPPPDAPSPFALSDPARVRALLAQAGFADIALTSPSEPVWFGANPDEAHRFLTGLLGWMLDGLDTAGKARALDTLHTVLAAHAGPGGVELLSGTWLITATQSG
jgi:SAM-dependent methyltransferase